MEDRVDIYTVNTVPCGEERRIKSTYRITNAVCEVFPSHHICVSGDQEMGRPGLRSMDH